MYYPSERVKVTRGIYENGKKIGREEIIVNSCVECGRYAEHFAIDWELVRCKYCDFAYCHKVHMVMLEAYGKIQPATLRVNSMLLLSHALKEHPFHFKKK